MDASPLQSQHTLSCSIYLIDVNFNSIFQFVRILPNGLFTVGSPATVCVYLYFFLGVFCMPCSPLITLLLFSEHVYTGVRCIVRFSPPACVTVFVFDQNFFLFLIRMQSKHFSNVMSMDYPVIFIFIYRKCTLSILGRNEP
jgi:hypothetical protein